MKTKLYFLVLVACIAGAWQPVHAQTGYYNTSGYFFNPVAPRPFTEIKFITQLNDSVYETGIADIAQYGYTFTFQIDSTNHLVNWHATGSNTPVEPASGFMTSDNPGNFSGYPDTTTGYTSDVYNNTYDPVTKTFYMHYGYGFGSGATDQNGYSRQFYEKFVPAPPPAITSFSPVSGTSGTVVTVKGISLLKTDYAYIGDAYADVHVLSDSAVEMTVYSGSTGVIYLNLPTGGIVSTDTFYYTPPVVTDTSWRPAGNAGFSAGTANYVSMAVDTANVPYVVYQDATNGDRAMVMKLDANNTWVPVGSGPASDGGVYHTNIAFDKFNTPYIAYVDSTVAGYGAITVRRLVNNNWELVGSKGFDSLVGYYESFPFATVHMTFDTSGQVCVLSSHYGDFGYIYNVRRFNGTDWEYIGEDGMPFESIYGDADLAVDKQTNTVYVVSDDVLSSEQAVVVRYVNGAWETVGGTFTNGYYGIIYPSIQINSAGQPVVAMQDDDTAFERISVYQYDGSNWTATGEPYFSPNHCYDVNMVLGKNDQPYVAYNDYSYNDLGSVVTYANGAWQNVGGRGFAPSETITWSSLAIGKNGIPYIAISDTSYGFKATVLQYDTSSLLPVHLLSLTAALRNRTALVSWKTSNEVNAAYYTVQRSTDGVHFVNAGKVAAMNISGNHSYQFSDDLSSLSGVARVYYRLQITDKDGSSTISSIVNVDLSDNKIVTMQPNPARSYTVITCSASGKKTITVTDMNGKKVLVKITANNTEIMPVSSFAKGIYFVRTDYASGYNVQKLVIE